MAAELLFEHIKGIGSELHDVPVECIQAYVLITVTLDGRLLLSTNITREDQVRGILARQAMDRRPFVLQVPDTLL